MGLFSDINRLSVTFACVAAFSLTGCQNTTTVGGGNAPSVSSASQALRVQTPLPVSPAQRTKPPPAAPLVTAAVPAQKTVTENVKLTPPEEVRKQVRVALLLPLSGDGAAVGRVLLNAAMLAVFDVADSEFILLPIDTKGSAEGAAIAADEAIAANARLVIGPVFSGAVRGAATQILNAGLNMLAFSNDRAAAEPGVYLSGLFPETQIDRVVKYAAGKGLRRIGALIPPGPFGRRVKDALQTAAIKNGVKVTRVREYGETPDDISDAVRKISNYDLRREALLQQREELEGLEDEGSRRALARLKILETIGPVPFDALLVAASGDDLVNAAAHLGNFDIDTKRTRILGTSSWVEETTGREPTLVGAWFATPPVDAAAAFSKKYRRIYETAPIDIAKAAYDMVALAAILGSREDGPKFDRPTLTAKSGFIGVGGLFRFENNGLVQRSLEVREVQIRGNRQISPARQRFNDLGN